MQIIKKMNGISAIQISVVTVLSFCVVVGVIFAATTIGTDIVTTGSATMPMINSTSTNVGTFLVYSGSTLTGLTTATDLRPSILNASTTNVDTLTIYDSISGNATSSADFVVGSDTHAATTTLAIKAAETTGQSCLEMINNEGEGVSCYVGGVGGIVFSCAVGACK